jgi:hypothetical protein
LTKWKKRKRWTRRVTCMCGDGSEENKGRVVIRKEEDKRDLFFCCFF